MPDNDLILAALLTGLWAAWLANRSRARGSGTSLKATVVTTVAAMVAAVFTAPQIWPRIWTAYRGDTLYDLDPAGAAGLALLSAGLVLVLFWLAAVKTRWLESRSAWLLLIDPPLVVLIFMLSIMIIPQVYYIYYTITIPGLPIQWVAKRWIGPTELLVLAQLPASDSLAAHLSGLVLRGLALSALWRPALRLIDSANLPRRARTLVIAVAVAVFAGILPSLLTSLS